MALKTVTELTWDEVRWFYYDRNTKYWLVFRGYDSAIIEKEYRKHNGLLIDDVLKELPDTGVILDGLFKVNENVSDANSLYWKEEPIRLWRGTWFESDLMKPILEEDAKIIEEHHLKHFGGLRIFTMPVYDKNQPLPVLTKLELNDSKTVIWNSVIDITQRQFKRVLLKVGITKQDTRLSRGYNILADFSEGRPAFDNLVLVVHGIGQKGHENLIAQNTTYMRKRVDALAGENGGRSQLIILPVEWRSSINLNDNKLSSITLPKMSSARALLNSCVSDVMYYQTPKVQKDIRKTVIELLNSIYTMFLHNSGCNDINVSVIAHSLGSVIMYDIITKGDEENDIPDLAFKVKYLFNLGSPLAAFLILNNVPKSDIIPPADKLTRMFNIFHPYDPVAYRIEALFNENYRLIRPLSVIAASTRLLSYFDDENQFECYDRKTVEKLRQRKQLEVAVHSGQVLDQDEYSGNEGDANEELKAKSKKSKDACKQKNKEGQEELEALLLAIPSEERIKKRIDFSIATYITDKDHPDVAKFLLNVLYTPLEELDGASEASENNPSFKCNCCILC